MNPVINKPVCFSWKRRREQTTIGWIDISIAKQQTWAAHKQPTTTSSLGTHTVLAPQQPIGSSEAQLRRSWTIFDRLLYRETGGGCEWSHVKCSLEMKKRGLEDRGLRMSKISEVFFIYLALILTLLANLPQLLEQAVTVWKVEAVSSMEISET